MNLLWISFTMAESTPKENKNTLKYVSLITLTLQNAILGLSMRYGRVRVDKEHLFFSSTGKANPNYILMILNLFQYLHAKYYITSDIRN